MPMPYVLMLLNKLFKTCATLNAHQLYSLKLKRCMFDKGLESTNMDQGNRLNVLQVYAVA